MIGFAYSCTSVDSYKPLSDELSSTSAWMAPHNGMVFLDFFFNDPGELGMLMKTNLSPVVLYDLMAITEDVTAHALQRVRRQTQCRSISVEKYPDTIFDLMAITENVTAHALPTNLMRIYQ